MADITAELYDPTKQYRKVLFQKGRVVLDAELNAAQDQAHGFASHAKTRAKSHGVVRPLDYRVIGTGLSRDITIGAGTLYVQGQPYTIDADTLLSVLMATSNPLPTNGGADRFDWVYVDFQETEFTALDDGTMTVAAVGETAIRRKMRATWGVSIGSVPGAPAGEGDLLTGNTWRVVVARIFRPTGQAAVNQDEILALLRPLREVEGVWRHETYLRLDENAAMRWISGSSQLQIGALDATGTLAAGAGLGIYHHGGRSLLTGVHTVATGKMLCVRPNYLALSAEGVTPLLDGTLGTQFEETYDDPVVVVDFEDFDPNAGYVVIAMNFANTEIRLNDGDVLGDDYLKTHWGRPQSTEPVRITVSPGLNSPRGDISTGAMFRTFLEHQHSWFGSSVSHVEIVLRESISLPATGGGTPQQSTLVRSSSATRRITLRGEYGTGSATDRTQLLVTNRDLATSPLEPCGIRFRDVDLEVFDLDILWDGPTNTGGGYRYAVIGWSSTGPASYARGARARINGFVAEHDDYDFMRWEDTLFTTGAVDGRMDACHILGVAVGDVTDGLRCQNFFHGCTFESIGGNGGTCYLSEGGGNHSLRENTFRGRNNLVWIHADSGNQPGFVTIEDNKLQGLDPDASVLDDQYGTAILMSETLYDVRVNRNTYSTDPGSSMVFFKGVEIFFDRSLEMSRVVQVCDNDFSHDGHYRFSGGVIAIDAAAPGGTNYIRYVEVSRNNVTNFERTDFNRQLDSVTAISIGANQAEPIARHVVLNDNLGVFFRSVLVANGQYGARVYAGTVEARGNHFFFEGYGQSAGGICRPLSLHVDSAAVDAGPTFGPYVTVVGNVLQALAAPHVPPVGATCDALFIGGIAAGMATVSGNTLLGEFAIDAVNMPYTLMSGNNCIVKAGNANLSRTAFAGTSQCGVDNLFN